MSAGHVVAAPPRKHSCSPGWTYSERGVTSTGISMPCEVPPGYRIAFAPSAYAYPAGTVWECECGRVWVSLPAVPGQPGVARFRPERRLERRRRERKARQ